MNFDRNTVLGFVLLAVLFFGYFFYNNKEQAAYQKNKARADSIAAAAMPKVDTVARLQDSIRTDSVRQLNTAGGFGNAAAGTEQLTVIENNVARIAFTNKGGQPRWVELKNFKGPDSGLVRLAASNFDKISYPVISGANTTADVANLYFTATPPSRAADNSQLVSFQLTSATGGSIVHQYLIRPNEYFIRFNLKVTGAQQLLGGNTLNLRWQNKAVQLQKDLEYERQQSFVGYRENGDYSDKNITGGDTHDFEDGVQWVALKQQFFVSSIISDKQFSSGNVEWTAPDAKGDRTIAQAVANLKLQLPQSGEAALSLYYGPNDYKILKGYGYELEDLVNLGSGMFAFVKWINRWVVLPVFDFFSGLTSNYGIVILLLTLFIRLLISPLTYTSYLSGAKMKVLRPEIDKLKEKYGTDQQQISMEQMKLFREAGVNPLGGCIPALFQIPIFFALYSFFNSNVALRGKPFLWADDLSQYDSILNLPFEIPFYGDHISLFTITATVTSLLISLYSMSMAPDQSNPVMKYMPYFFPIILLFVFNKLPAALTWYYTVSNIITLLLQFIIQNYIINHDKILAKMEENRKKPKAKSKWAEKFEQIQEQQKRMQELQSRTKK